MTDFLQQFCASIQRPEHRFADSLAFIAQHYVYQPVAFRNGPLSNAAGENQGSCKILALALLEQLSTEQSLLAFGEHYRYVLNTPEATDHQNIRQLLRGGLNSVQFAQPALTRCC